MSQGPLPQRVNIRKAVTRRAHYHGVLGSEQLPRFADVLTVDGVMAVSVDFGEDDEGQQYLDVDLRGEAVQQCQRCLQPMRSSIASRSRLGLVASDEQAALLPRHYEPWIALDEVDLWDVAAEELALALPVVAYHDEEGCRAPAHEEGTPAGGPTRADNPFNVLSTLLDSGDTKEK